MKKKNQNNEVSHNKYTKGDIFVKIMAGILAILMVAGTVATLVFALMR